MPKTATSPAALMRTAFEAVGRKDLDALVPMWHPDLQDEFVALGLTVDFDGARRFFAEMFTAFEPFTFDIGPILESGDTSVGQWTVRGTFRGGPWNGFEPTGGEVELRGIDVMEWTDGLLHRNTIYFDGAAVARQLGLLPAEGSKMEMGMTAAFNGVQRLRKLMGRV